MGHSSKKKKKRGSGGRKSSLKDDGSFSAENSELINDELTALCAIFQEDCKVVSESPPEVSIKLRPYSKDTGYENSDISAFLSIRFLPGYPNKCPKMQILPEKGLSEVDADKLLSLLLDQANYNCREGRVMIYNLVEAAQEFLSEIVPLIPYEVNGQTSQLPLQGEAVSCAFINSSRGPFVNVHVDLFSASGESWHWNLGMEQNTDSSSSLYSNVKVESELIHQHMLNKMEQKTRSIPTIDGKLDFHRKSALNLISVEEGSEDECKSNADSSRTLSTASVGSFPVSGTKDIFAAGNLTESSDNGSVPSESDSSDFVGHNGSSQTMKTDLIMAHLLRLACASKGPLADALPQITSELYDLGIVGERVRELALKPSSLFDRTFGSIFGQEMVSSTSSSFWKTYADFGGQHSSSVSSSRFLSDFEELQPLGQGGFGHVVLCKNKLDGRQYAMKKIRLKDKSLPLDDRILREVATLSRLQHQHVVRYYQAWFETGISVSHGDAAWGSRTAESSTFSFKDGSSYGNFGPDNKFDSTYLYIQMEYCPRTLRQMFESYNHFDKERAWHLFRQIVEGLAHIHAQGIIHRDLTPNNIFFDARSDIKIGDFGLAKFLKLEQMEQDVDTADAVGVSLDGTGQVGTYFYTAPEIEQGWPKINEKADMYSLGVVFLELWHPFDTSMERHVVLSELKQKGGLPSTWANEFPEQAALLKRLMSPSPSDRPSATELLQHAFPPRMEFELLDNILRTIHTSEDTSLYDKIVNAVFDEESLRTKDHPEGVGRLKLVGSDTSSFLLPDTNTANRDHVVEVATKVFRQHCAKHLEIIPLHLLGDDQQYTRTCVKLLTQGGDMVELCHELRLPFVKWVIENQKLFFKRYEISNVYRRGIGHSPPSRYLQGDFDIIGGATALTEAEAIKATIEIVGHFFHLGSCDIHLNHGHLLEALLNWAGIRPEHWQKVAELLSLLTSLHPQSPERKSKWVVVRRQLRQELNLPEVAVNRLQTVGLRFCGAIDQTLPRLRGALPEGDDSQEISKLKALLAKVFEVKDLGNIKYFLGMEVARTKEGISVSQRKYTLDLLQETGMLGCKPALSPIDPSIKLIHGQTVVNMDRYQRLVGKLLYLSHTRPDIAYAVSIVSQFLKSPTKEHWDAVYRILRYLKKTPGQGLFFKKADINNIIVYTDADWAGNPIDRRSTTGYCSYVWGTLVTWRSKKQPTVSRSSAEAELRALVLGVCEGLWLRRVLSELNLPLKSPIVLRCDNKSALCMAEDPIHHDKTKHVDIDRHFIKEKIDDHIIDLHHVSSHDQHADLLTKAIPPHPFSQLCHKLGCINIYNIV